MERTSIIYALFLLMSTTALSARPADLALKAAIDNLDYEATIEAVRSGADVNQTFPGEYGDDEYSQDPRSPLLRSATNCRFGLSSEDGDNMTRIADYLIRKGADVNWQQRFKVEGRWNFGYYPLLEAVSCKNERLVKLLLEKL